MACINAMTTGKWAIEPERHIDKRMMHDVAGKVVHVLKNPPPYLQLLQSFVDFAEKGIRRPKEEVDKIVREFLYPNLYSNLYLQDQYLLLSGYMWKDGKLGGELLERKV
jgi:hypothetical protein